MKLHFRVKKYDKKFDILAHFWFERLQRIQNLEKIGLSLKSTEVKLQNKT